jgi:hypothetical protein
MRLATISVTTPFVNRIGANANLVLSKMATVVLTQALNCDYRNSP